MSAALSRSQVGPPNQRAVELLPANTGKDLWPIALGWLAPGIAEKSAMRAFERQFAAHLGGGTATTFAAGRVALASILDALKIGPGDEVIVPGYTCVAVPNPVIFCGARPVYADIDLSTTNVTAATVERVLSPRTRAVVVQHTFGVPACMDAIVALARSRGVAVIEDCTHALGAEIAGCEVGCFGDAAFFSFEQTKVVSAAAGGVAFTRDPTLGARIAEYQQRCAPPSHRKVRQSMAYLAYTVLLREPRWAARCRHADYYLGRLGLIAPPQTTDAEMRCERPATFQQQWSGAQARVGASQMAQLSDNLAQRRAIAEFYEQRFRGTRLRSLEAPAGSRPSWVRFPFWARDKARLAVELRELGIQLGLWFTAPVHPAGVPQSQAGYLAGSCPNAELAVAGLANLPCHPRMTLDDARRVAKAVLQSRHA